MGRRGRELALREFSQQKVLQANLAVYLALLDPLPPAPAWRAGRKKLLRGIRLPCRRFHNGHRRFFVNILAAFRRINER